MSLLQRRCDKVGLLLSYKTRKQAMWSFVKHLGHVSCYIFVGVTTRYGLDSPGIESRCGRDFPHPYRPAHPDSYNGYWVAFPGVKRPGPGVDHPHASSADVKERVEPYPYSVSAGCALILSDCDWKYLYFGHHFAESNVGHDHKLVLSIFRQQNRVH